MNSREAMEERNRKIIDAVLRKEKALCPGAIAMIGIYGSFLTGDIHPLSDLDLLILINDDRGWQLSATFIQDDAGVGHDIYCTSWEGLMKDAAYEHPYISKLMDSKIVYCADEEYTTRLESLRAQVREQLAAPFSEADYLKAENCLNDAMRCFASVMIADSLTDARRQAGGVLYYAENAVAMLNKTYFRKGVRRCYEELDAMEKRPEKLCEMIDGVLKAETAAGVKESLTLLMKELSACFDKVKRELETKKKQADAEMLSGTYEEMFSNWHGKMILAAETGDRHLAFMTLSSLNEMMKDIGDETDIGRYDILSAYDPEDLKKTAEGFDRMLQEYLQEYAKAGIVPKRYESIEAFADAYTRTQE